MIASFGFKREMFKLSSVSEWIPNGASSSAKSFFVIMHSLNGTSAYGFPFGATRLATKSMPTP